MSDSSIINGNYSIVEESASCISSNFPRPTLESLVTSFIPKSLPKLPLLFDTQDPAIHQEILRMILQYLENHGYQSSFQVLNKEAQLQANQTQKANAEFEQLKSLILEGNWAEADKLCSKPVADRSHQRAFIFAYYKHQFLELIELRELQKAFTLLHKRIKPLESMKVCTTEEFRDLSYLLTTQSVHDVAAFKSWEGIYREREQLIIRLSHLSNLTYQNLCGNAPIPPHRLLTLLDQAVQFQVNKTNIESKTVHSTSNIMPISPPLSTLLQATSCKVFPYPIKISSLLQDFEPEITPSNVKNLLTGHSANVKAVQFVGTDGQLVVSGSSDATVRLWDLDQCTHSNNSDSGFEDSLAIQSISVLKGHEGRIWDLASSQSGKLIGSASADRTVKVWDISNLSQPRCITTLTGHRYDVYGVDFHPWNDNQLVSSGYDHLARLYDISRPDIPVKVLTGHQLGIPAIIFNPTGKILYTGSKDRTVKFWDSNSGLCTRTLSKHLGEITSLDCDATGVLLLTSAKDNAHRLWDTRMLGQPLQRYKGHLNTSRHFIRARLAGDRVISGSEDGHVYAWDRLSGQLMWTVSHVNSQSSVGPPGPVYDVAYHPNRGLISSSEDKTLILWTNSSPQN